MTFTADEIRATIELAGITGLVEVPERLRTLAARLEGHATSVAVVGMVKRGKSTLFNRLVGVEVSAVSATPETAATIQVMTGPSRAWGRTENGKQIDLPTEPERFADRLRRRMDNRIIAAVISGRFRMPEGLILIDTPGVGDVATKLEDDLARLDEQWLEAGAGAALVVLSTTFDSRDRALVEKAHRAFPGAVEIVLKPTSRDTTSEDVLEVSRYVESEIGVRVMPLLDSTPTGEWGADGAFAALESMLLNLSSRAEARLEVDIERFESFLDLLCREIQSTGLIELPVLLTQRGIPTLPTILQTELEQAITRLSDLKHQLDEAAMQEARKAHAAQANTRASSLIRLYEMAGEDWSERISILTEVAECAAEGGDSAEQWMLRLLVSKDWPSTLARRLRFVSITASGVSDDSLLSALDRSPLTTDDIDHILRNSPDRRLRTALERIATTRVSGASSTKIRSLSQAVEDPRQKSRLSYLATQALASEQESAIHASIQTIRSLSIGNLRSSRLALHAAIAGTERKLATADALSSESLGKLRTLLAEAAQAKWESLGEGCITSIRVWFETFPASRDSVEKRLESLLEEADLIVAELGKSSTSDRLNALNDAARSSGGTWLSEVFSKSSAAQAAVERRRSRLQSWFAVALLGMFVFAFACYSTPFFILAGIGAFIAAAALRAEMTSVAEWQNRMPRVVHPAAVTALGVDAPGPLKLPPIERNPDSSSTAMGGCALIALATLCTLIALFASIAYGVKRSSQQAESQRSYYSGGMSSPTSTRPPSSTTTISRSSTSTTSTSSTTSPSTPTTRTRGAIPTELSQDFAYQPDKCGVDATLKPYPHSPTRTYEVTATIGLWRAPSTTSSRIGVISVTSFGRGGIGCPSGSGPEVTVTCQVEGEAITGPFGTDTIWLKVRIDGYTGYVTDQWVDTRWDVSTDTIPSC